MPLGQRSVEVLQQLCTLLCSCVCITDMIQSDFSLLRRAPMQGAPLAFLNVSACRCVDDFNPHLKDLICSQLLLQHNPHVFVTAPH